MEISEGSIYPLLRRLKKDHLVTSYLKESIEGPPRKYYKLTLEGVDAYINLLTEWETFQQSINGLVSKNGKDV
jgi:PadR family transcriptional regulator PadR